MIYVVSHSETARNAETALKAAFEARQPGFDDNLVIAIGGDGTMLRAITNHAEEDYPFLGISAGKLGFLQVADPEQIDQLADAIIARDYNMIETPLLSVSQNGQNLGYAFNDISVERDGPRTAKFALQIGESIGSFIGDGIIFSTPLGSTAYTLAAGGPIVDAKVRNVFVVTPNNPHISVLYSTLQRPHILDKSRHVLINIDQNDAENRPVRIVMDGQAVHKGISGSIEVCYSDHMVRLIELKEDGFHNRIESKRLGRY